MGSDSVALPPGFELDDEKPSGTGSLPPGFEVDETPQWSDLPKNIGPDAMGLLKGNAQTAARIGKGVMDLPSDVMETAKDEMHGNFLNTPVAEDVKTIGKGIGDAVSGIPESIGNLGSKEQWINHPVQNALTAGSIAAPMVAPAEGGIASAIGKSMADKGASLATDLAEVSGDTVKKINPRVLGEEAQGGIRKAGGTPNIADVRTGIGEKLLKDNVVGGFGQDVGDRLQKVNQAKEGYGKQVDSAIKAIKEWNKSTGEYKDVDDAIHVQSNPILKSVLDTANELRDSARSGLRQSSRYWRETYNSLSKKAESNNGRLNLDDIRSELHDVGKDMNSSPNSPRFSTAKDIYGHLAEVRDGMVNEIAKKAGNPELAKNLMEANKGYSFYSKISDGLEDAAAGGEVPEKMGKHLVRATMRGNPLDATGYLGLMKTLNSVEPALAQKLSKWGPGVAKYGGVLESAAKKGPKNLAFTSYLISQKDPEYAQIIGGQ